MIHWNGRHLQSTIAQMPTNDESMLPDSDELTGSPAPNPHLQRAILSVEAERSDSGDLLWSDFSSHQQT